MWGFYATSQMGTFNTLKKQESIAVGMHTTCSPTICASVATRCQYWLGFSSEQV